MVVLKWIVSTLTAPVSVKVAVEVGAEACAVSGSRGSVLPPQSSLTKRTRLNICMSQMKLVIL